MEDLGFRRPLGLVLSGGGSLAAWQAGCLYSLIRGGLTFDHLLGFSSGALNGGLYFLGKEGELLSKWRRIDDLKVMRFQPSWKLRSFFSSAPIWNAVDFARDDQAARRNARCLFTVIALRAEDGLQVYPRFSPGGKGAWDAPLASWLVASCSIPRIFPAVTIPVRGEPSRFIDGGVPGRKWISFDALAGCKDVLVLEMVRPDEIGRQPLWGPFAWHEQNSREVMRRQINSGIDSLRQMGNPPRIFRLYPSRRLDYYQLVFKSKHCVPALELGMLDGMSFLKSQPTPV